MERAYRVGSEHEGPMGRILEAPMRHPYGMTLASRPRQLHDEDKSCGIQPAHIRVIDRRLLLLMFCLTLYAPIRRLPDIRGRVKVSNTRQLIYSYWLDW